MITGRQLFAEFDSTLILASATAPPNDRTIDQIQKSLRWTSPSSNMAPDLLWRHCLTSSVYIFYSISLTAPICRTKTFEWRSWPRREDELRRLLDADILFRPCQWCLGLFEEMIRILLLWQECIVLLFVMPKTIPHQGVDFNCWLISLLAWSGNWRLRAQWTFDYRRYSWINCGIESLFSSFPRIVGIKFMCFPHLTGAVNPLHWQKNFNSWGAALQWISIEIRGWCEMFFRLSA